VNQIAPKRILTYGYFIAWYFFDHGRIFIAGDDLHLTTTFTARFNVDVEVVSGRWRTYLAEDVGGARGGENL
jgi:hypothetical protein